ncbi:MAG: class I SAM-dependent methyltransferase [Lachnospiraceae bacterium]
MIETIGDITLDLTHYPGEDFYCDGVVEDELLEIVQTYSEIEYDRIIEERKSWPILYHLSTKRQNIVEWLPIDKSMKVLEIGSGCGAITGELAKKAKQVDCIDLSKKRSMINAYRNGAHKNVTIKVGNFLDIEPDLDTDYDYICLIGVFEYGQSYIGGKTPFEDFFRIIHKHKKEEGSIAIAIENKFGLKYWAGCKEDHLGTFFSGIEDYPQGGGVRTFSRQGLEKIFKTCKETKYSFYYPYPDYKFMHTLFSDDRLPQQGELVDNLRNFDRDRLQLFDEKQVFDALIEEEMFPFYSNSYMVIIGETPNTAYARYSNDRSIHTSIATKIIDEDGKRVVRKEALTSFGKEHIKNIYEAFLLLEKRYAGSGLSINKCKYVEGEIPYVELEYIEGETLAAKLDRCIKNKNQEEFFSLFKEYFEKISFDNGVKISNMDMIFSNILIHNDVWTVIDYEWTKKELIAPKEIAFRSLYCYSLEQEFRNQCNMDELLSYLDISYEESKELQKAELRFQKEITKNHKSMSEIRELLGGKNLDPKKWMQYFETKDGKSRVQLYEDIGKGYSEEHSLFIEDAYVNQKKVVIEQVVSGNVIALRLDPCMESCLIKVQECTWNGGQVPLHKKNIFSTNGCIVKDALDKKSDKISICFKTDDPNMEIQVANLERKAQNTLYMEFDLLSLDADMANDLETALKRIF